MTGASTRLRDWNDGAADVPAAYTPDSLEFQRDLRALLDEREAAPARIEELAAEVERMREALKTYECPDGCNECAGNHDYAWCGYTARAALAGAPRHE